MPLLILMHGGGGSAAQVQRSTQMDVDADQYGFVVAYPNGSGRLGDTLLTWNSGHCCGYALQNQVDDVGFLSLLIDRLIEHYSIDPNRVYLAGMSNGAMMAYRAGAELADKVAGIGPVSGSIGGRVTESGFEIIPPSPTQPVSVMAFNGKQDQHVPYEGGIGPAAINEGRVDLSVDASISYWVEADGCDALPETIKQANGNIIIDTYSGCKGDTQVVLVTIVDGGHAWPGGRGSPVGDVPTQDILANQMMLEFFLAHPKK